jgi:hypothetical protein
MPLTKQQLLTLIGTAIDAAQAAPDKEVLVVEQLADTKYKVRVKLGPDQDRLEVTRRKLN